MRTFLSLIVFTAAVRAQMPMDANMNMNMAGMNPASMYLMNLASGTSLNPDAWPMPMIMTHFGQWNTMFMVNGFIDETQQTGARGHDKFYSTNWAMATAQHRLSSRAAFEALLMLSLEPATITDRSYPLLFQTGETAFGLPLVDAQHPHNLIMALGFHYTRELAEDTIFDLYFAPVGDPALGPVAYPHRASAMDLPQAPISHHLQDSTHISDEVITAGIARKKFKLEASGFHGAEPGENRWIIQTGAIDSWSARAWYLPSENWAAQISAGRITHPEALESGDQFRTTASVEYSKPINGSAWSSSLIWGRVHETQVDRNLNSYLLESLLPLSRKNFLTGRVELADKDELFDDQPALEQQIDARDGSTFRIRAYTIGYTRDIDLIRHVETGLGANVSLYSLPAAIKPYYGAHPAGVNLYLRFRLD